MQIYLAIISLSTVVLNNRDQQGMYGMQPFACLETHLTIGPSQKMTLMHWHSCNNAIHLLNKGKS